MKIDQNEREKLLRMAYESGYNYFDHSFIELEDNEHLSVLCSESYGNNSLSNVYHSIEDHFGFDPEINGWDSFGIYPIIEDASVCYEAGARDGIENNEFNPDRINHMWNY